jgi:ABC-type multidrug transport system fused ATPase/permease subunit
MVPRLSSLQQFLHSLNAYSPSIGVLMKLKAEAVSRREYQGNFGMSESPSEELVDSLKFERLSVSYKGGSTIGPLTFSIKFPGFTALVGASGSGKSTIVAAILRLVRYEGQIEHGGRAIEEFDIRRWRNHLGYVPQDPMFFHASIRDNLCITRENATDEEIAESLKIACLDDFISELPDGLDTVIGDQGSRLSGGQRQRLGIARSILSKPKILLLDEATSSLDPNLEQEILAQLNILKKSIGIIFVAHSLSPIQTADSVVVMHQGKLQDIGTWQELVERSDIFRTVINHGMRVSEQR